MLQAKVLQFAHKWAKMHYSRYQFEYPILIEPRKFGGKPWALITVPSWPALRLGVPNVSLEQPLALNAKYLDVPSSGHLAVENGQPFLEGNIRVALPSMPYEKVMQDNRFASVIQRLAAPKENTVEVSIQVEDVRAVLPFRSKDDARENLRHLALDFTGVVATSDGYRLAYLPAFQPPLSPHPERVAVIMPQAFYTQLMKKAVGEIKVRVPVQESDILPEVRGYLSFAKKSEPVAFMVKGEGIESYPDFWHVTEDTKENGEISLTLKEAKGIAKLLKKASFAVLVSDQDNKLWLLAIWRQEETGDFQVIAAQQIGAVAHEYLAGFKASFMRDILLFAHEGKIYTLPPNGRYWHAPLEIVTLYRVGVIMPHVLVGFDKAAAPVTREVMEQAAAWGVKASWVFRWLSAIEEQSMPVPA